MVIRFIWILPGLYILGAIEVQNSMSNSNGEAKRRCVRDNFSFPTNVSEPIIDSHSTEQLHHSGTFSYRPRKRNLSSTSMGGVAEVNQDPRSKRRTAHHLGIYTSVTVNIGVSIVVPGFGMRNVSKTVQDVRTAKVPSLLYGV
nr:hypothetical protein [Tanacetum cinerariifolium]